MFGRCPGIKKPASFIWGMHRGAGLTCNQSSIGSLPIFSTKIWAVSDSDSTGALQALGESLILSRSTKFQWISSLIKTPGPNLGDADYDSDPYPPSFNAGLLGRKLEKIHSDVA